MHKIILAAHKPRVPFDEFDWYTSQPTRIKYTKNKTKEKVNKTKLKKAKKHAAAYFPNSKKLDIKSWLSFQRAQK